jgi:hypothetical protein
MRINLTASRSALIIPLLIFSASHVSLAEEEPPKPYPSPTAVFDAYRQAYRSSDWRTFYLLFTPEAQRDLLFGANIACEDAGGAKLKSLKAVQEKFGPDEAQFGKMYFEAYKQKHDHAELIDKFLAKAVPFWKSKKNAGAGPKAEEATTPPPEEAAAIDALPKDDELGRQALYGATKDKIGFFVSVQTILEKDRRPNDIGDLEQLIIKDDTAEGSAKVTIMPGSGESPEVRKIEKTFKFRRVNDGWLLDSL